MSKSVELLPLPHKRVCGVPPYFPAPKQADTSLSCSPVCVHHVWHPHQLKPYLEAGQRQLFRLLSFVVHTKKHRMHCSRPTRLLLGERPGFGGFRRGPPRSGRWRGHGRGGRHREQWRRRRKRYCRCSGERREGGLLRGVQTGAGAKVFLNKKMVLYMKHPIAKTMTNNLPQKLPTLLVLTVWRIVRSTRKGRDHGLGFSPFKDPFLASGWAKQLNAGVLCPFSCPPPN